MNFRTAYWYPNYEYLKDFENMEVPTASDPAPKTDLLQDICMPVFFDWRFFAMVTYASFVQISVTVDNTQSP